MIGVFLAAAAQVISIPIFRALSDRIGRRMVYGGGALAAAVFMIPYFWLIDSGNAWAVWLGITLLGGCIYSALAGSQPASFSELVAANVRYTGVAGAREFGAIAGGAIPLIAAALSAAYSSATPVALFVICMCVVTIVAVMVAPETRGRKMRQADERFRGQPAGRAQSSGSVFAPLRVKRTPANGLVFFNSRRKRTDFFDEIC